MIKRFNYWLGDKLTLWLSSMGCFYLISIAILSTLFFERPVGVQAWLIFWVTVFFQGVALPVLGYVSRKAGEKQEQILKETHDAVMEELVLVRELVRNELKTAKEEREILKMMVESSLKNN